MAPVFQLLFTADLLIPDWNPRKLIEEGPLRDLMAYIQAGGFVPPILVWGGDGRSVIAGQRRLMAYRRLGITQIEVQIMNISLKAARRLANSSNEGVPLHWLDRYEGWELDLAEEPELTDEQAGAAEGTSATSIRRAKALLAVLNPASRRLIRDKFNESQPQGAGSPTEPAQPKLGSRLEASTHLSSAPQGGGQGLVVPSPSTDGNGGTQRGSAQEDAKNKGNNDVPLTLRNDTETLKNRVSEKPEKRQFVENVAFQLTALWDKRSIQEAQALVEKALPVILSREMNGPQVKALVKWVSTGNDPESFGTTPNATPKALNSGTAVTPSAHLSPDPQAGGQAVVVPSRGAEGTQGGSAHLSSGPQAGRQGAVSGDRHLVPSQSAEGTQGGLAHLSPAPQGGGQGLVVPSQSAEGTQGGLAEVGSWVAGTELAKKLHLPKGLVSRLIPHFTRFFQKVTALFQWMGVKNQFWAAFLAALLVLWVGSFVIGWTKYLIGRVFWTGFAYPSGTYLSIGHKPMDESGLSRIAAPSEGKAPKGDPGQVGGQALVEPSQGADSNGGTQGGSVHLSSGLQAGGQVLVVPSQSAEGTKGGLANSANLAQAPSSNNYPSAVQNSASRVVTVQVSAPTQAVTAKPQGDDLGKKIGDEVKDYQSAVSTATDAKSATDKLKGLIGF